MTNIIIEGPDNHGKSTLSVQLDMALESKALHIAGRRPKTTEEYRTRVKESLILRNKISDRSPIISNHCYNFINELKIDPLESKENLYLLSRTECGIVFCFTEGSTSESVSPWDEKEYLDKIEENKSRILSNYKKVLDDYNFDVITYDYHTTTPEQLILMMENRRWIR